jgi:hypothetical protein
MNSILIGHSGKLAEMLNINVNVPKGEHNIGKKILKS